MDRLVVGLATLGSFLAATSIGVTAMQGGTPGEVKKVRLTPKDFRTTVAVADGDLIELWLPSSMPYGWVADAESPLLKPEPISQGEREEIQKAQRGTGGVPVAGKPATFAGRYRVHAEGDVTAVAKWTYCKFNDLARTERDLKSGAIPTPPPFDPTMKVENLKPGIVYEVTVQAHAR